MIVWIVFQIGVACPTVEAFLNKQEALDRVLFLRGTLHEILRDRVRMVRVLCQGEDA